MGSRDSSGGRSRRRSRADKARVAAWYESQGWTHDLSANRAGRGLDTARSMRRKDDFLRSTGGANAAQFRRVQRQMSREDRQNAMADALRRQYADLPF